MGIVNVTPDSFSDGGRHFDAGAAVAAGLAMVEAGAALLDIGGESTRPGSAGISVEEERRRVIPVIRGLRDAGVPLSVDTRNAATMAAALEAGAAIVNDISALAHDPGATGVVARWGCPVILMHMRGTPATMMQFRQYGDVAADVTRELQARMAVAEAAGIAREQIALDPGIGFAKGETENLAMLAGLPVLCALGRPVVVGVSRKAFIGRIAGVERPEARGPGSLAAGLFALGLGAAVLRVHDVAETVQGVRVWQALAASATPRAPGQLGTDR
jgi:dihydropteroate synthase